MWFHVKTYRDKNGRIRRYKTVELRRIDNSGNQRRYTLVGSLDRNATSLPRDLAKKLTPEEREEFQAWCRERDENRAKEAEQRQYVMAAAYLHDAVICLANASRALDAGIRPRDPEKLWSALDVLARTLTGAGYPKPKQDRRGRPSKEDVVSAEDLFSPYDDPMLRAEMEEVQERLAALPNFIPPGRM